MSITWEQDARNQLNALEFRNPSPGLATFKSLFAGQAVTFPALEPGVGQVDFSSHESDYHRSWAVQVGWVAAVITPRATKWLRIRSVGDSVQVQVSDLHVWSVGLQDGT